MSNEDESSTQDAKGLNEPIRLDFRSTQQVLVVPDDEDRFVTTSREAALACKQHEQSKEWDQQYRAFLSRIRDWCEEHSTIVSRAYLSVARHGLRVFLVTRTRHYDFSKDALLTALDLGLAKEYPLCPATVLQIPVTDDPESITSFLSPQSSLQIYG